MPGLATTFVLLCIILGTFRNARADQQPELPAPAEGGNPNAARRAMNPGPALLAPGPQALSGPPRPAAAPAPGYSLVECFACTRCPEGNSTFKLCPYSPNVQSQGRCVIYAEKYHDSRDHYFVRGCASELGTCADIKRLYDGKSQYVELLSCADCEGDLCNGAARSLVDVTVALLTLVVVPIVGKCTLA